MFLWNGRWKEALIPKVFYFKLEKYTQISKSDYKRFNNPQLL